MDVAGQFQKIRVLLDDDRLIAVLKEMAGPLVPAIEIDHIAGQQLLHTPKERPRPRGHQEVEVVRHEGPRVHDQVSLPAQPGEPLHEVGPIGVRRKDLRPLDPTAHNVVHGTGRI
jgi:hypothetical protein